MAGNLEKLKQLIESVGKDPYEGMSDEEVKIKKLRDKIETLLSIETIRKLADKALTKEDVQRLVEALVKVVKETSTREYVNKEMARVHGDLRGATATLEQHVKDIMAGQIGAVDAKLKTVKDGKKGEKGDTGERGRPGVDGLNGKDGKNGVDGKRGKDGTSGGGRIGWGAHPLQIQDDGTVVTKIARLINFIGATITQARDGTTTVAFSGGGFDTLAATETPNGTLTAFTFATATAQPSYIISDNVWLKAVSKAGTVNWTWLGNVATLTIPPQDDVWGVV